MVAGQPFYPRVMNYGITFASNVNGSTNPAHIYITPDGPYDRLIDDAFECNSQSSCQSQLLAHFNQIASMGFNTVRITGLMPEMFKAAESAPAVLRLGVRTNTGAWATKYQIDFDLDQPSTLAVRYFQLVNGVLDMAALAGLKVIVLTGIELRWSTPYTGQPPTPDLKFLGTDAQLYATALYRLADGLKAEEELMAYDLLNEPAWRGGTDIRSLSKSTVCDYTSAWYNAVKDGSDGHHLVTLGGIPKADLGNWDPAVMKLDFYSPHPYIEPDWTDGWDMTSAIERYKAELYWTARKSTMPWMVGETGFSADDQMNFEIGNNSSWVLLRPEPEYHRMPYMHGSEDEQADFAEMSMDLTREYLGSGYSWWNFQNSKSPPITAEPEKYLGNFWGALGYGDGINPWREKDVVLTFEQHVLPASPSQVAVPPPAYSNWHALNTGIYRTYHAHDQNDQPVIDALAEVNWIYTSSQNSLDASSFWDHVVSASDGLIILHKPPSNVIGFETPITPEQLNVHASGAVSHRASGEEPWVDGSNLPFPRDLQEYANTVTDIVLVSEPAREYKAWAELTVENATILSSGTSQTPVRFVARQFVHVTGEFHAGGDSEVNLLTDETFQGCNIPYSGLAPTPPGTSSEPKSTGVSEQVKGKLEIRFLPPHPMLLVFPNPCMDLLTITSTLNVPVTILNAHGAIIYQAVKYCDNFTIDTANWSPGAYVVQLVSPDGSTHTAHINKLR